MSLMTTKINREISVYINRKGTVIDVSVGDSSTVSLPEVEGRRSSARLSGVRCIHTHPNSNGMLSGVDLNSLITLRLDAMVALGVREGNVVEIYAALPAQTDNAEIYGPFELHDTKMNLLFERIMEIDKGHTEKVFANQEDEERAILVGLETSAGKTLNGKSEGERSLDELEELAFTAGALVAHKVLQKRPVQDPAYFIGKGKVEELSLMRQELNANTIIFDDELSGAQVRNIEELTGAKVIDRTTLILDIFAQRARSREGKLQVELAQLKYRLPRLIGLGSQLSRLGGGIGTRGPGEKKLEVDRRHIRRKINYLENELSSISRRRGLLREGRKDNNVPTIALVGYTNAGKSTLMNKLCKADVLAEDKLFATLDPTTRRLMLPDGREALLIDTVGFIRKLPHDLVEAFKSTLEEAVFADILMHVADASSEEADTQISVVNDILINLGISNKEIVLVLNKMDLVNKEDIRINYPDTKESVFEVSAANGRGVNELLTGIAKKLPVDDIEVEVLAPYSEGWVLPYMYDSGKIIEKDYIDSGVKIKALIKKSKLEKISDYIM
ncbi:MAG: GTPase HflX [Clostridia bacterium]|nr:GTPase HflX [Clostridia bacterium]